jgi:hypothetical protein
MKYKGWRIMAVVNMPRVFEIKDLYESGIEYGSEIKVVPALKVSEYKPSKYLADKNGISLDSYSIRGLKKLIKLELKESKSL